MICSMLLYFAVDRDYEITNCQVIAHFAVEVDACWYGSYGLYRSHGLFTRVKTNGAIGWHMVCWDVRELSIGKENTVTVCDRWGLLCADNITHAFSLLTPVGKHFTCYREVNNYNNMSLEPISVSKCVLIAGLIMFGIAFVAAVMRSLLCRDNSKKKKYA